MFVDVAEIKIRAGKGGDGAVAFRREKYVPRGGPAGGNGGAGGNVLFVSNENLNTLLDFRYKKEYYAEDGKPGGSSLKDGRKGVDTTIEVPVGTILKDIVTGEVLYDFKRTAETYIAAKGGKGGRGNSNFATPSNQAPRYAENGRKGGERHILMELKLIADIGLVGFPNSGKSTLISVVSAAKPKIADYPFTTLEPNLGIVSYKEFQSFTIADIPGIIEGASDGKGLGLRFLRHIERTNILCFLIESISEDPANDLSVLMKELKKYSPALAKKRTIIAVSKCDLIDDEQKRKLKKLRFTSQKTAPVIFSAVTGENVDILLQKMWNTLKEID